jgi:hypothetical protein
VSKYTTVLLQKLDEGLAEIRAHYQADLTRKKLSRELLYAVRQVIQDCQSLLDATVNADKEKHVGTSNWSPYFPLAESPTDFPAAMERQINDLDSNIVAAFERHQPYQPGKTELGHLHALARVNKHRDFTPQTRQVTHQVTYTGPAGSLIFDNLIVEGQFEVDVGGPTTRTETIYVDWRFVDPPVSVLPTLEALARLVREAVEDIRREAQL